MKPILILALFFMCLAGASIAEEALPELKISSIQDGVYLHTSFHQVEGWGVVASNGLIYVDEESAYIIDTPSSPEDTAKLVEWVNDNGFTVAGSISTHFHDDSAAGIAWLNSKSIPTYATDLTNTLLQKSNKTPATNAINKESFWLVESQIEVFYPGPGHTEDNVVVWLPKQKVLFGGCFVKQVNLGNLEDAVLEKWPDSAQKLIDRYGDAQIVVQGHGEFGDVSLLVRTKELALEGLVSLQEREQ